MTPANFRASNNQHKSEQNPENIYVFLIEISHRVIARKRKNNNDTERKRGIIFSQQANSDWHYDYNAKQFKR